MRFSFERGFVVFFMIVIIAVVALGITNYNKNRSYFESTEWVEHTHEVLKESTALLSNLQDLSVRLYITTGDTSFLDNYSHSNKLIVPHIDSLKILIADNPGQLGRIDSLRANAMDRMDICSEYIKLYKQDKIDSAAVAKYTTDSRANMARIRSNLAGLKLEEEALLKTRKATFEARRHEFNMSVAMIFVLIVLLLTTMFIAFLLFISRRKKDEANILKLNAELVKNVVDLNYANKELESFSYSVSHDLRAPLRIIDGFAKILSEEYKNSLDNEAGRFIDSIRKNAQHMGELIDDLLNFSRISRQELIIHDTNMNVLVNSVVDSLGTLGKDYKADIKIENLRNAVCDEHLIRQVWSNLIANAIKYSRKNDAAVIKIGSKEEANEIIYYVADNGVGFDMAYADKLFGVFQRLHKVSDYEGTGVGLALVHRIISRHKGRAWAEAKPNEGATFYFSLPK